MADGVFMSNVQVLQRLAVLGLMALLLALGYQVLAFFFTPILWAMILGYVSWPLYQAIQRRTGLGRSGSALLLLLGVLLLLGIPATFGTYLLQQEVRDLYGRLQTQVSMGQLVLPEALARVEWLRAQLQPWVDQLNNNPSTLVNEFKAWMASHLTLGKQVFSAVSQNLAKLGLMLLTLFFIYRDGQSLLDQVRRALQKLLGPRADHHVHLIGQTTRAVVYGIGVTALVQGLLAGLGYWVAGAPSPLILTLLTILIAFIPFGTPFAWAAIVVYMLAQGDVAPALGLLAWCLIAVSWVDNIIRPALISGETQLPFLVVMFGVLGGLAAFGMVGVFVGPVLLAVLLGLWRDWLAQPVDLPQPAQASTLRAAGLPAADSDKTTPVVLPPADPDR